MIKNPIRIGDTVTTSAGDRVNGTFGTGVVYGIGKWRDFLSYKIKLVDGRKTTVLRKNAVIVKRGKKKYK